MKSRLAGLAGAAALALATPGCSDDREVEGGDGALTVYVSAPLNGPRAADGRATANGAKLALEQARGMAGQIRVRGVYLDDTDGGDWSLAQTAANARRATADVTSIGYVGDLDSGATRVSLPITNQAGIAQVSPGSTAVDLTRLPPAGGGGPERLLPSERETFARVVPDDEVQARAAALWAKRMGARNFAATSDRSDFGEILVKEFVVAAQRLGMRPFFPDPERRLVPRRPPSPEALYYGGLPQEPRLLAQVFDLARTANVFGSDALIDPVFLRTSAPFASRLFLTSPFLDPALLPPRGQRFLRAYRSRFGRPAAPAAAYGYEAMTLLLDAVRRAGDDGDDRRAVVDELLATPERRSVLGTYAIDANGDTTLDAVTGYRVADGLPVFPIELVAPR